MTFLLEAKKLKRTGYLPAFLGAGIISCAFPVVNMLVRSETFTNLPGDPFEILMDANWQMMAMLNILISICGACIMYHTEYADNGVQKMDVLPVNPTRLFFSKAFIANGVLAGMICFQMIALAGCAVYWFPNVSLDFVSILKTIGFQWLVSLPTVMLMLLISSMCKNMWISLGTGVILVFTLSIIPQDNLILSLFPFSSPYQTLAMAEENAHTLLFGIICVMQTVLFYLVENLYVKARRYCA